MPDNGVLPWPVIVALSSLLGGVASFVVAGVRARAWLTQTALEAIESRSGRASIAAIAAERQVRIEDKLDALARGMDAVATRLETRIDTLQAQVTQQISKLDAETRQLEIRLVRIENSAQKR